ncbi:MAG: helix-turn-helix domain-containing protein [Clostridia bacterium]|nr:helix-turn-helix domain-containing protein [Clostridia bacterium]
MATRVQSQNFGTERIVRYQLLTKVYTYPSHLHQFAELLIPLENELDVHADGRCQSFGPGQAAFISPFQTHGYVSNKVNKVAILVFSPYLVPDFFKLIDGKVGQSAVFTPKKSTLDVLNERLIGKDDFDLFEIKGLIYLFLNDYLEQTALKDAPQTTDISARIVEYITDHITDDITLDAIARVLSYTPNYLSSRIKEIFGMNLCSLIASIRCDKARYLLHETNKTGAEICYECGFGSERSFLRQFKAMTGRTPKEYRSMFNGGKIRRGILKRFEV